MKPYSQACENNKKPILKEIHSRFESYKHVLEIGSGTGQHAVFFAEKLNWLKWHSSDCPENHSGIKQWIDESGLSNVEYPINLNVSLDQWPKRKFDAVFTANTCHIMCWEHVIAMFEGVKEIILNDGLFVIYGPFNYDNSYTSKSNQYFDIWLKESDSDSGIRNFEDINSLAAKNSFKLLDDISMPANNRLLFFKRK